MFASPLYAQILGTPHKTNHLLPPAFRTYGTAPTRTRIRRNDTHDRNGRRYGGGRSAICTSGRS